MNYAWEAVLQAEKHGRQLDSLRFVEAHDPSPYKVPLYHQENRQDSRS